jgi:hypothetical protein
MHRLLLTAISAAALIGTSPAASQSFTASSFNSVSSSGLIGVPAGSDFGRTGHRRHIHVDPRDFAYYESGYNDYGDYDANRSFDPDKWNDWWHERPERAFPRWMSRNQDCSRRWYSGDVLTC